MTTIIIYTGILLIIISIAIRLKKPKFNTAIKDYSSDKEQNRTFLQDIQEGFCFNPQKIDKSQIKKDVEILSKVIKFATTMPKEKKFFCKKLVSEIKKGKLVFNNGLTYDKAVTLINLSVDDIGDLVYQNKEKLLKKFYRFGKSKVLTQEDIENAKKYSLSEKDLSDFYSKLNAAELCKTIPNEEQYKNIYEEYLLPARLSNENSIKKLAKKLDEILTEEQREELKKYNIKMYDLSVAVIYYGEHTDLRYSRFDKLLSEENFKNREVMDKLLRGIDTFDDNGNIISNDNCDNTSIEFKTNKKTDKLFKKISFVNAYDNDGHSLQALQKADQRYIKIPKTIVNFDFYSNIHVNKKTQDQNLPWINHIISKYFINNIFWVIPEKPLRNICAKEQFFGEGDSSLTDFKGNYNKNIYYNNYNIPLSQEFLFDITTSSIITDSVNYSKEQIQTQLKTGNYRLIKINTCTPSSLPKMTKEFILSIDGNYFSNTGLQTEYFYENIPFDLNIDFNEFLDLWKKKLQKASIVLLCVSSDYVGYPYFRKVRGFYEYILKQIQKNSNKYY